MQCKNCLTVIATNYDFCPKCGQNAHLHRLSMHDVAHEVLHYFTHADKGLFHLLKALATKTGAVAREYCEGKRKSYFSPLNFFLIMITISFFVVSLDNGRAVMTMIDRDQFLQAYPDPHVRKIMERFVTRWQYITKLMLEYYKVSYILTLPIYSLFYWLMLRREKFNFTEHLVANMYMQGFTVAAFIILQLLTVLRIDLAQLLYTAIFMLQFVYFAIFYYKFMNFSGTNGKLLAATITFIVVVLTNSILFGGILIYCFLP